jgi:hypothetical protein
MVASWVLSHTSKGLLKELELENSVGTVKNRGNTGETLGNLMGDSMSVSFGMCVRRTMWDPIFFKAKLHS